MILLTKNNVAKIAFKRWICNFEQQAPSPQKTGFHAIWLHTHFKENKKAKRKQQIVWQEWIINGKEIVGPKTTFLHNYENIPCLWCEGKHILKLKK
jgi:hypothetical protein